MDCATDEADPHALQAFPVEVSREILLRLGPQDIIPLQRVSKQFRAMINDHSFWATLYAESRLLRPPGPFPWHSTEFLQRTLVRSARLAQRWTSHPINVLSMRRSLEFPRSKGSYEVLCGRWLIVQQPDKFVLHDINTGSQQVLHEPDHWSMKWDACSLTSTRGSLLYLAVCQLERGMKLYEFHADENSGHLSGPTTFDVPYPLVGIPAVWVVGGNTPFVFLSERDGARDAVIFDTRNHIFHKFPELTRKSEPKKIHGYEGIVLSTTHIIVIHAVQEFSVEKLLVQAYIVPSENELHPGQLRPSHQAIIMYNRPPLYNRSCVHYKPWRCGWSLLRDSVVDPITGSTHLRLLHTYPHNSDAEQRFDCADFTLPANSTEVILPMSIETHLLFDIPDFYPYLGGQLVEASPEGLAQGLCIISPDDRELHIRKFSIDATGERCMGVVGSPHLPWPRANLHDSSQLFDYTRGRMLYTTFNGFAYSDLAVGVVEFE